jgi:predicted Ser/Thr protein kinase
MEQFFGKYKVKHEIGRGAMGSVLLAFDTVLERDVAIKTIASTIREEHLKERFIREARAAGKLLHNNIVTIYDFGVENDRLFIAMEYLPGMDLYQVIAERRPIDIKDKLEFLRQICLGLDFAHAKEVYHRDIKPANVRLLEDGTIKIVDFGLAVMQTSSLTQSGAFLGTPNYVAPERLHGQSGDGRSDQFAAGIVLYELLTYTRAFTGENISTVMFSVLNDNPRRLDPVVSTRYPELWKIILRSVAKKAADRYPTMKEMAGDIGALIEKMKHDGFTMTEPVPVRDEEADATAIQVRTDEVIRSGFSAAEPKKNRAPVILAAAAVLVIAALLAYFLALQPKKEAPPPAAPTVAVSKPGYLAFQVIPYAVVEEVVHVESGEKVDLGAETDSRTTPLRLELTPGAYRITYSHPQWRGARTRVITVSEGDVTLETGRLDEGFIRDAVEHFKAPLPESRRKGGR